jgi:hypothetical protein
MASTYSPSLKLELIGNGDQSGTWGTTTNNNTGTLLEQAITGVQSIVMANADYTLSNYNGTSDEARNAVLVVTGTNSGIYKIIAPLVNKTYIIYNNTTGGYAINIGGTTGSPVAIPNGITAQVYCDGTNFYSSQTGSAGNFLVNGTLTVTGNQTETGNITIAGTLTANGAANFNGTTAFAGTTTAVTQSNSDNTTKLATTAFVTNKISAVTSVPNANAITNSGGWSVTPSGTKLYFNYNGTNVASLDSSGNFIALGNVSAYTTP